MTATDHDGPMAYLQSWRSEICMDIMCECGEWQHVDGEHIVFVQCKTCGKCYELDNHIKLTLVESGAIVDPYFLAVGT